MTMNRSDGKDKMHAIDDFEGNCSIEPLLERSGNLASERHKIRATRFLIAVVLISALNLGLLVFNLYVTLSSAQTDQLVSYCRSKAQVSC
jgi:hypothetical protein